MSIKLTVREAIAAYMAIEQLPKLPSGKVAYDLGYISDKLESAVRTFEKQREKARAEFAETVTDKDGATRRQVPAAKMAEFTERIEQMLEGEVSVERNPIKLADVLGAADLPVDRRPELAPTLLRPLLKIIVE